MYNSKNHKIENMPIKAAFQGRALVFMRITNPQANSSYRHSSKLSQLIKE
jgi:hypothetical protein